MPEYLSPGVYIEEVSYRAKAIEGVSTTTTAFIGATRYGPVFGEPLLVTSLVEYERMYGDRGQLRFTGPDGELVLHNYMWHAARAFFENGGKRLYVSRAFEADAEDDGRASGDLGDLTIRARHPGAAGEGRLRLTLTLGQSALSVLGGEPRLTGLTAWDLVWVGEATVAGPSPAEPDAGTFYLVRTVDGPGGEPEHRFQGLDTGSPTEDRDLDAVLGGADPATQEVRLVRLTADWLPGGGAEPITWTDLALDPRHRSGGREDSLLAAFDPTPPSPDAAATIPIVIEDAPEGVNGLGVLQELLEFDAELQDRLLATRDPAVGAAPAAVDVVLEGGSDGLRPGAGAYAGADDGLLRSGLLALEDVEDVSIIAAPGATFGYENGHRQEAATTLLQLISHAERMRYRIAVLDSGEGQTLAQVRAMRASFDSKYAALYFPWVRVLDPVTRREIPLPPSGFVAGIYARNDTLRAVYKAPANEVVSLALGFEQTLNKAHQDVLNPEGINCFRFFEGRGMRLWGARTISSDPEWKYVNLRRYFIYLERSIDRGTQWAVFEPNGEALWANVRRTIEDFLFNEWVNGALLGDKPERAYFVKCDRSTMTQNDLDNGRLVCLVGVAALRPAEFVIFRIGQWTADRRS